MIFFFFFFKFSHQYFLPTKVILYQLIYKYIKYNFFFFFCAIFTMNSNNLGFLLFFIFFVNSLNSHKLINYKKNRNHITKKHKIKNTKEIKHKKKNHKRQTHKKNKILHSLKKFGFNFKKDLLKISWMFLKNNNLFKQTGLKSFAYKHGKNGIKKKRSLYKKYKFFRSKRINDVLKYRKHFLIWG